MEKRSTKDKNEFIWILLGCLCPQISIALHFINKEQQPNKARNLAIGACITISCLILVGIYLIFDIYRLM